MDDKYLQRHAEIEAAAFAGRLSGQQWEQVLVVPAYREAGSLVESFKQLAAGQPGLLLVLVLNQPGPETDPAANAELRGRIQSLPGAGEALFELGNGGHLLLAERPQALPADQGVGLARKIGCDIALALHRQGQVRSSWLHNSDADATLPADYFSAAERHVAAAALSHAFRHRLPADPTTAAAISVYELRLHYYVLGLRGAGSPYAFHTLGSCLSVRADAYAGVRGFPRRAGAEDFYLLNKVAKLGDVVSPAQPVIELQGRVSDRVPFGTGPALSRLIDEGRPLQARLFYEPRSFAALRTLLASLDELAAGASPADCMAEQQQALAVLAAMNIDRALAHCRAHSRDAPGFRRHFHQWFDGFRTLKFLHGLRERGFDDITLAESRERADSIWPEDWVFAEALPA